MSLAMRDFSFCDVSSATVTDYRKQKRHRVVSESDRWQSRKLVAVAPTRTIRPARRRCRVGACRRDRGRAHVASRSPRAHATLRMADLPTERPVKLSRNGGPQRQKAASRSIEQFLA
jgi:hypothetical protein